MRSKILKGIALACSGKVLELVEVQFRHLQTVVAKDYLLLPLPLPYSLILIIIFLLKGYCY